MTYVLENELFMDATKWQGVGQQENGIAAEVVKERCTVGYSVQEWDGKTVR